MTTLADVLQRLAPYGVRQEGAGWRARCPSHHGKDLNLKIDYKDGKILFCCHSRQCSQQAIREALGMDNYKDTSPKEQQWEIRDITGKIVAIHIRREAQNGKSFLWKRPSGQWGLGGGKASDLPLYNTQDIPRFVRSHWVYICEGEKATDALKALGAQALGTITGAHNKEGHSSTTLEALRGFKVALFPDNDEAGLHHMGKHAITLQGITSEIVLLDTITLPPKGDAVEWIEAQLKAGKTKQDLRKAFTFDELIDLPHIKVDEAPKPKEEIPKEGSKKNQAQIAIELIQQENLECWFDAQGLAWCSFEAEGHTEHHQLNSSATKDFICQLVFQQTGIVLGDRAVNDSLATLKALTPKSRIYPVFVRAGEHEGKLYLDLGSSDWSAIEVDLTGWRINKKPLVRFQRAKGMLALPTPLKGGDLSELRGLFNVTDETKWRFLVAWLLATLRPKGPYPICILQGEAGSAKSTTARMLRALVDPNACPLRTAPRDERDLAIAATNSRIVAYDNLSGVSSWLSDALCRVTTGGGFATRTLHTNNEETLFQFQRPVLLNGIDEVATRGDLADRALLVTLPRIEEEDRREESEVWKEFEEARPHILGALLDVVSAGLKKLPSITAKRLPRMADFAKWILACEEALGWKAESFLSAYFGARKQMAETLIEGDLFAKSILEFLEGKTEWLGEFSPFLTAINHNAGDARYRVRGWPETLKAASDKLRRIAPSLAQVGWTLDLERRTNTGRRIVYLFKTPKKEPKVTEATEASEANEKPASDGKPAPEKPSEATEASEAQTPFHYRETKKEKDTGIPIEEESVQQNGKTASGASVASEPASTKADFTEADLRQDEGSSPASDPTANATEALYGSPGLAPNGKTRETDPLDKEELDELAGKFMDDGLSYDEAEQKARDHLRQRKGYPHPNAGISL